MERLSLERDNIKIDGDTMYVYVDGVKTEQFTTAQYFILQLLMNRPNRVYSRNEILEYLHGSAFTTSDRTVDVHVVAIRNKLGAARDKIASVRGVGYRFVLEEQQ